MEKKEGASDLLILLITLFCSLNSVLESIDFFCNLASSNIFSAVCNSTSFVSVTAWYARKSCKSALSFLKCSLIMLLIFDCEFLSLFKTVFVYSTTRHS